MRAASRISFLGLFSEKLFLGVKGCIGADGRGDVSASGMHIPDKWVRRRRFLGCLLAFPLQLFGALGAVSV